MLHTNQNYLSFIYKRLSFAQHKNVTLLYTVIDITFS